jgi:predicted Zn-dependent peptidase
LNRQFDNPSNFDLVIAGNLNLNETKKLVEKYLAGIPGKERTPLDTSKLPGYEYPAGIVVKEIEAGIASGCKTHISFPSPAKDNFQSRMLGTWIAELLAMHFNDNREKCYKFECDYVLTRLPGLEKLDPSSMEIEFTSLPEHIHEVNSSILKEMKRLQCEGFSKKEIHSYKAQLKESWRKDLDNDSQWIVLITNAIFGNYDVNRIIEDFNELFDRFDEKIAKDMLQKLFPLDRYVQITLLPKMKNSIASEPASS